MTASVGEKYTVSDGQIVLTLEPAEEGGFVVTSPLDPELITEAETIQEAFANARDATEALNESRAKLIRQLAAAQP
jgi:antitoxin HicB